MAAWWIRIAKGKAGSGMSGSEATLADWDADSSGVGWLDALVAAGKAQKLRNDGFPTCYEARAGDVLPLAYEVTGKIKLKRTLFKPDFRQERIEACLPDDVVTIEAWDQL